jgi:hypothetical protein
VYRSIVCALLLLPLIPAGRKTQPAPPAAAAAVPLRMGDAVTVSSADFGHLFQGPILCDGNGNIALLPVELEAGHRPIPPDTVVRVSADGKTATRFRLADVEGVGNFADSEILRTAFDVDGNLYVLAVNSVSRYVVAFSDSGKYKWKVALDVDEMLVSSFAVFKGGELLLSGSSGERARVAVRGAGGSLSDVVLPDDAALRQGLSSAERRDLLSFAHAEPAADGLIYFSRQASEGFVYALMASGEVKSRFALAAPSGASRLAALKVSGHRLAAIYRVENPDETVDESDTWWIVTHDLAGGEPLATYGPVRTGVLCYRSVDGFPDRFSLLGMSPAGQLQLVEAFAP